MNRFNNKKYYKPPPVKPSNRLREKPKEDWNPYQSDLNKYKLSNAEILKKKINATSKNLEEAKRDWQGQIAMIQNGKMKINFDDDMEGRQKIVRKKIDLTPMNRFEKRSVNIDAIRNNDRNIYQNNRINRPYSGYEDNYRNKTKKNNSFNQKIGNNFQSNPAQDNNFYDDEDDDGEIKMVYNTGNNANVIETKIKKENNFSNYNNDISNNAAFNEFEKTIQKMQEHLQQKNENKENNLEIKQNEVIFNNENNMIQKQNNYINNNTNSNRKNENNLNKKQNKKINKKNIPNNANKKEFSNNNTNPNKNKNKKRKVKNEENKLIDDLKKDINDKFNNLEGINELDNCMKQLDFMIAKSKQKSIQNRLNDDSKNPQFYRSENENFYQNNTKKEPIPEQNNKYLENINDKFQPSYKKNIKQNNTLKDTNNKMKNFADDEINNDNDYNNNNMNENNFNINEDYKNNIMNNNNINYNYNYNQNINNNYNIQDDEDNNNMNNENQNIEENNVYENENNNYNNYIEDNQQNDENYDYENDENEENVNDYNKMEYNQNINYNNYQEQYQQNDDNQNQNNNQLYNIVHNPKNLNTFKYNINDMNKFQNNPNININQPKRDYKEDFNYMKYKSQLNDNQNYSYGTEQRSLNIKPNIINMDSKQKVLNQYENNEINVNKNYNINNNNNNSNNYNYNYNIGPDPDNEAQMNYLKNLLEKTKSEIDQLNNNMDEDASKAFNIYK